MSKHTVCCALALALVIGVTGCSSSTTFTPTREPFNYVPQPIESRQITDNTLGLQERWRISSSNIGGNQDPLLLASSGRVVCPQCDLSKGIAYPVCQLTAFDAASGDLLWETSWEGIDLAVDAERVYTMFGQKLRAYSLQDGQLLWKHQKLSYKGDYIDSDGEKLRVRTWGTWKASYLDARTGDILSQGSLVMVKEFVLLAQFPQFDLHSSRTALLAKDRATQKVLWMTQVPRRGVIMERPVLVDDMLVVGYQQPVFAIDTRTGQLKWDNLDRPFVSNFVVMNDSVYALDPDARLVQLDPDTGQETGYIQFTLAKTDPSNERYWIASEGQMLFLSFDDSQELIALGP